MPLNETRQIRQTKGSTFLKSNMESKSVIKTKGKDTLPLLRDLGMSISILLGGTWVVRYEETN